MSGVSPSRPGRRPGRPDTRAAILDAARSLFAENGYDRATMREIAAQAGVNVRLLTHYFGSKQQLFVEAVELPFDPGTALAPIIASADDAPAALAAFIAATLERPDYLLIATGLIRAAASDPTAVPVARDFLTSRVLQPVAEQIGADQPELRASLLASQVAGLIMVRAVLGLEPLASSTAPDLASALTPVVRHYLMGPLD